jgi:hypothetical protein
VQAEHALRALHPARDVATRNDDVFVARIASSAAHLFEAREDLALDVEVLEDRLDDEVGYA